MSDLAGFAGAVITRAQLQRLLLGAAADAAVFEANFVALATELGVGGVELLNSLLTTTTVEGAVGSLAKTALATQQTHGLTAAVLDAAVSTEMAATGAAAGAAGGAAGGGAAGGGGVLAALTSLATGLLIAAGVVMTGAVVVTGAQAVMANSEADKAEADAARQRLGVAERQESAANNPSGIESGQGLPGYAIVQVTNHPSHAIAVIGLERLSAHESGSSPLELCNFLHGGRCGGAVIETPNGDVVADESPLAQLVVLGRDETSEEAWKGLCQRVSNVRPAALAEGFVGDLDGRTVTIDSGGFTSPC